MQLCIAKMSIKWLFLINQPFLWFLFNMIMLWLPSLTNRLVYGRSPQAQQACSLPSSIIESINQVLVAIVVKTPEIILAGIR
jgi:hypothetical protein